VVHQRDGIPAGVGDPVDVDRDDRSDPRMLSKFLCQRTEPVVAMVHDHLAAVEPHDGGPSFERT